MFWLRWSAVWLTAAECDFQHPARVEPVPGAVIIVILLVLAPVFVIIGFAVLAAVLGQLLWMDGEARHEGSELLDVGV